MQTELKTAKDDKLVDLDVSGEGAEIELEDKSHGTVKPDKYEDVKTEEVEPLAPKVEVAEEKQSEEMDQYSDKVKKRIDKLTYKIREAEREKDAALQYGRDNQACISDDYVCFLHFPRAIYLLGKNQTSEQTASSAGRRKHWQTRHSDARAGRPNASAT